MATLKYRDKDGVWKYAPSLKYKNGNDVFEITNGLKYKDEQGVWHKVNICGSKSDDNGDYPTISTLAVGSSVYLNENGSPAEYLIVHQGLPSDMYDASCDGVWLLRKEVYENREWHSSNANDYAKSTIHNYLNNTFLGLFDSKTQLKIKQVKIPYNNGLGTVHDVNSGENGLSTKVFLLSYYEVGYTSADSPLDGVKLNYFTSGSSAAANDIRIAYMNGTNNKWGLRSPVNNNTQLCWTVSTTGNGGSSHCSALNGVRPALILPYNVKLDPNTNTIVG